MTQTLTSKTNTTGLVFLILIVVNTLDKPTPRHDHISSPNVAEAIAILSPINIIPRIITKCDLFILTTIEVRNLISQL